MAPTNADMAVAISFCVIFALTSFGAAAAAFILRARCTHWRERYESLVRIAAPYVPPVVADESGHGRSLAHAASVRREMTRLVAQWQLLAKMHSTVLDDRSLRWRALLQWLAFTNRRLSKRVPGVNRRSLR